MARLVHSRCKEVNSIGPLRATPPVEIAVAFKSTAQADRAEVIPGVRRIGGTRIELTADAYLKAFRAFYAVAEMSSLP